MHHARLHALLVVALSQRGFKGPGGPPCREVRERDSVRDRRTRAQTKVGAITRLRESYFVTGAE